MVFQYAGVHDRTSSLLSPSRVLVPGPSLWPDRACPILKSQGPASINLEFVCEGSSRL